MVKTAVILAAGLGSRLGDRTREIPKGFVEVGGKSLISRSIEKLLAAGVERVILGTGYLSRFYEELARENPRIETVKSDRYETTSSMYTLYNLRHRINESFLLLESDLLYEERALHLLQIDPRPDIILGSGMTFSNDEVFLQTDGNGFLVNLSKKPEDLASRDAELVGISKVSLERYDLMNRRFEEIMDASPKADYESLFARTAGEKPFPVKKVEDLVWCEIDDENHLNRAQKEILPKLGE